jgi:amidase
MTRVPQEETFQLSGAEAARRIAQRRLTSVEYVEACLNRIALRDADVRAWAHVDGPGAVAQARRCDQLAPRSPLHGVPIGLKDIIDTADLPTSCNSPIYAGHRPPADASCVAQLRDAGCVILGKTVTTEFASSVPAGTRNPHNLGHTPGGSSSGSAAAVADAMVPIALGTQTGGSVIRPAAFCGVVGYKPSFGSIGRAGIKFVAETLDTIGVHARSVEDVALTGHILSGRPLPDFERRRAAPRVGLFRTAHWNDLERSAQAELDRVAALLEARGAHVFAFRLQPAEGRLMAAHATIMAFEAARLFAWECSNHADRISPALRDQYADGRAIPRADYENARSLVVASQRQIAAQLTDVDFLLTPSAPGEAPSGFKTTGHSLFNRLWSLLGLPCLSLPSGKGASGLPLGIQMVGAFNADTALLECGHWLEGVIRSNEPSSAVSMSDAA